MMLLSSGGLAIGLGGLSRVKYKETHLDTEVFHWILVAPDNTITIRIPHAEMGQGSITSIAQLLADELEVDWSTLRTEYISIAHHLKSGKIYGSTGIAASMGVKGAELLLRTRGAQIRTMFIAAGAERLWAPVAEIVAEGGCIVHTPTGRRLLYAELATDVARLAVPDPLSIKLKPRHQWTCIGRSMPRLDIPGKVTGAAVFGIDVSIPGMKHAAIAMSPVLGGKLASYDANAALSEAGVRKIVEIRGGSAGLVEGMDDAIAVVADSWWQARKGRDALAIKWENGATGVVDTGSIVAGLRVGLQATPDTTLRNDGDADRVLYSSANVIQAEYYIPYLSHAAMEPINCTALVTEDTFQVWAPTQEPEEAIEVAARIAGMPIVKGELHIANMGGSFGRGQYIDYISQTMQIAAAMKGVPVKLLWSREDTIQHGFFRPTSLSRVRGAIDADGNVTAWWHRVVAHSDSAVRSTLGADSLLYSIPNVRIERVVREALVPEGAMRGVGFAMNCFVTQSFIDELARAIPTDTWTLQRKLLDPETVSPNVPKGQLRDDMPPGVRVRRLRAVLDVCAEKVKWGEPLGPNRGRGIAVNEEASAFYAVAVEVTLDGRGWLAVDRVVVAGDPGFLLHPDNANAQVEGSVAFALSAALHGEITLSGGRVRESNFHDYAVLRLHEMPIVETHWVLSRQFWGGVGEPVVAAVIPALTNAIYDAGGPRIRSLPIKNEKLVLRNAGSQEPK
jgi:isoquinoline 1-oxidoreductase beta subunit